MTPLQKANAELAKEKAARLSAEGRVKALTSQLAALQTPETPAETAGAETPSQASNTETPETEGGQAAGETTPAAVETPAAAETPVETPAPAAAETPVETPAPAAVETPALASAPTPVETPAPVSPQAALIASLSMQAAASIHSAGVKDNPINPGTAAGGNDAKPKHIEAQASLKSWIKI